MNIKLSLFPIILTSILILFINSCKNSNPVETQNSLIFIEHNQNKSAEIIEGNYPTGVINENSIDYYYNNQDKTVKYTKMDSGLDNVKLLYGDGKAGDIYNGASIMNRLYGIKQLPSTIDSLSIKSLNHNGTAIIQFKGMEIELKINEEWRDTTYTISIRDSGKARIITEDIIKNNGFLEKENVTKK